jgi:hypothetical protein
MTAPEGYFYAAQDADSFITSDDAEPEEGAFYVWDYSELNQVLTPAELKELTAQFTVTEAGNFEGHNVLQRKAKGKLSDSLEATLSKLFRVRYGDSADRLLTFPPARNNQQAKTIAWPGRIPAVTDPKMIVAWNSLMISGLARAAVVLQQPEYLQLASRAAQFIGDRQWQNGRFHRVNYDGKPEVLAQSEDYALFIKALLDLDQASQMMATGAVDWRDRAIQVQAEFDEFLWSVELGGYYNTDASADLLLRERSYADNATPAANGIAVANLVRLTLLTEDLSYLDKAEQTLQAFGSVMERSPQACPSLFAALDWFLNSTLVRTTATPIAELSLHYFPTVVYSLQTDLPADTVGMVCQGLTCREPAQTQERLWEQVRQSQIRM